jgi:hypothetical protein
VSEKGKGSESRRDHFPQSCFGLHFSFYTNLSTRRFGLENKRADVSMDD